MTIKHATILLQHDNGSTETILVNNDDGRVIELHTEANSTWAYRFTVSVVAGLGTNRSEMFTHVQRTPGPTGKPYTRLVFERVRTLYVLDRKCESRGTAEFEVPKEQAKQAIREAVAQGFTLVELTQFQKPE